MSTQFEFGANHSSDFYSSIAPDEKTIIKGAEIIDPSELDEKQSGSGEMAYIARMVRHAANYAGRDVHIVFWPNERWAFVQGDPTNRLEWEIALIAAYLELFLVSHTPQLVVIH